MCPGILENGRHDSRNISLQGFQPNATPMNCNVENLVAIDGCITTILKNGSDTWL
jgi:hypothetical protein